VDIVTDRGAEVHIERPPKPERAAEAQRRGLRRVGLETDLSDLHWTEVDRDPGTPAAIYMLFFRGGEWHQIAKPWWMYKGRIYEIRLTVGRPLDADEAVALIVKYRREAQVAQDWERSEAEATIALAQAELAIAANEADHVSARSTLGSGEENHVGNARRPIPDDVKIFVWKRDGGSCIICGARANLEFDHIIPVALGGATTTRNLQLLCEPCNRKKGARLAPGVDV